MGNRAVITTEARDLGVYIHWNGGRDSVEAFLEYCRLRGFRPPETDPYGWARLCQVIANFFGADGLSVGVCRYSDDERMNPGDNGIYVIRGWRIVGRVGLPEGFEEQHDCELREVLLVVDRAQPVSQQIGERVILSEDVKAENLREGDRVFVLDLKGGYQVANVVGFGVCPRDDAERVVPIVDLYRKIGGVDYDFPLNYLREDNYRVPPASVGSGA